MSKQLAPLSEYIAEPHFYEKSRTLFGASHDNAHVKAILAGKVEVSWFRIGAHVRDRFCQVCKSPKFYVQTKSTPEQPLKDIKIVVCTNPKCKRIITCYLNERSHGNTPLRRDQIARGTHTAKKACCGSIYGVAHDTQEKVDNACRDTCVRHPNNKKGVK